MRVLQIGAGNLFGGIEVCHITLAAHRGTDPGFEQEYAYCFAGKAASELARTGVSVHLLGAVRYSRPWTILSARRRLKRLLRERAYHAVVCHEVWVHGVFASVVRAARVPLGLWIHDRHGGGGKLDYLARRSPPDFVIANSHWSAETLSHFLPGVSHRVIYCPVEADPAVPRSRRAELRGRFSTPEDAVVVLQVGRWERHKGHLHHLEALAAIRDVPGWLCWQVGAPQRESEQAYQDEVRARADQLGLSDRLRFLGWQDDLPGIRAAADVYCQPNIQPEPFGLTLVEALSAGLPVVASAEAGPQEIVTADCGMLARPGDTTELAAALRTLCADAGARQRMHVAGPARAKSLCDPGQQVRALGTFLAEHVTAR